jgi:antirestriction protein
LTNLGKYNEDELIGLWLELPCTDTVLESALKFIGIGDEYEEYFISDFENDIGLRINEYACLEELNEIAERIENLDTYERQTLQAIVELESPDLSDIPDILNRLDDFILYADIDTDEDIGYYFIHEAGVYDLDRMGKLADYIDYESFGRDIRLDSSGGFTSFGWLERI